MNASTNHLTNKIDNYKSRLCSAINAVSSESLVAAAELINDAINTGRNIFVCGNGGSASLSQHFSIDMGLGNRKVNISKGARIIDLSSNAPILTATANDFHYEEVFSKQIELLAKEGDLLVAISSSGNSSNILIAVETAKLLNMKTLGLCGFDGGRLMKKVDISVHVGTKLNDYGVVEDSHSFVLHVIAELIRLGE